MKLEHERELALAFNSPTNATMLGVNTPTADTILAVSAAVKVAEPVVVVVAVLIFVCKVLTATPKASD